MGFIEWGIYILEYTGNKLVEIYDYMVNPPPLKRLFNIGKRKVYFFKKILIFFKYKERNAAFFKKY